MTWSYSGDPSASDLDEVRWYVGDTDTTDQLAADEEILFAITKHPNTSLAAALVCESISAQFAREADRKVGDVSLSASQMADAYQKRADELRAGLNTAALPVFGGISISEKDTLDSDTDAVQPSFRVGQDDNPSIPFERDHGDHLYDLEDG